MYMRYGMQQCTYLEIDIHTARHVLSGTSFGEKGVEGIVSRAVGGGKGAVGVDAMLQAVELPAGVTNLG